MALNPQLSTTGQNAEADAIAALCNSGYIRLYTTAQPANANTAISGQTLLAELRFGATAFGSASSGVATANAITSDTSADNNGTATWFRVLKSDGTTVVFDGSVGTATSNLVLNTNVIAAGATVAITAFTLTCAAS